MPGLTGVWVGGAKLAAIGVRARKWVSFHGLALNVVTDLTPFSRITPCGIAGKPVGSVRTALAAAGDGGGDAEQGDTELLREYRYALLEAFEEVFGVRLVEPAGGELEGGDGVALLSAAAAAD